MLDLSTIPSHVGWMSCACQLSVVGSILVCIWRRQSNHLSCGGDFRYCREARPLSCMHIHHAPLSVLCFEGFSGTCCETETLGCIPVNVGLEKTPLSQSSPRSIGICAMRAQGALVAALSTRESNIHLCTAASVLP